MGKVKLTKGELKRQRDSLEQFLHYLPTLLLKKQQLQIKIQETRSLLSTKETLLKETEKGISRWIGLLADPELKDSFDIKKWVVPNRQDVEVENSNVAGVNIPVLRAIRFTEEDYDLYATPFWVDAGIKALREFVYLLVETLIIKQQINILEQELRVTTQRVNLFEKIKIPECRESIRVIRIYLGDQLANAVGISKVAKNKIAAAVMAF
jgi:V/A-type H+/Na+-transporting ATPase subunit D